MEKTNINPGRRWVICTALLLTALFCLALWDMQVSYLYNSSNYQTLRSEAGVWDLTGCDLTGGFVYTVGQVESIPGALLTPEEYVQREGDAMLLEDGFSEQCGSSRIRLLMPDDGWYTLTHTGIDYATRLYVNGELLTEVGSPAESADAAVPNTGRITFTARAEGGRIELIQQSSNFVHRSGGYHGGWLVGGRELGRAVDAADFAVVLEMGAYITLFLLHLLLFLMLPGFKPNLYFALCCLTWFMRMGTTGVSLFTVMAPGLSWGVKFRLEYAAVSLIIFLTALIMREVFPGILQRWALGVVYVTNAMFLLMCVLLPTAALSWVSIAFLGLAVLTTLYFLVRLGTKFRHPRADQSLLLAGIALMMFAAVRDIANYGWFMVHPDHLYVEGMQIAVLAFSLLAATAFFIATMREVQLVREQEQRLRDKNAALDRLNRLKLDFLQNITHELNTPLTVMSGYAQLTGWQLDAGSADAGTRENLRTISREAQRLSELVKQLLQVSVEHSTGVDGASIAVSELLHRAAALCAPVLAKNGNRFVTNGGDCPPVRGGMDMILQVLLNLTTNAGRHQHNKDVVLTVERDGDMAVFTLADEGDGIAPKLLPHVFERGISGDGGTGLGLAICRDVVETLGGKIDIESEAGRGTRVIFTLPLDMEDDDDEANHPVG